MFSIKKYVLNKEFDYVFVMPKLDCFRVYDSLFLKSAFKKAKLILELNESTFNINPAYYSNLSKITDDLNKFIQVVDNKIQGVSSVIPFVIEHVKSINTIYESYTQILTGFEISEKVIGGSKRIDIEKIIANGNLFLPKASNPFFNYSCSFLTNCR